MEKLKELCLMQCDTNIVYEIQVTEEIYNRASSDAAFAAELLSIHINQGINIFNGSVDKSLDAGPSRPSDLQAGSHSSSLNTNKKTLVPDENDNKSAMHNWTKEQVLLLIATYKEHQIAFLEDNVSKTEVWSNVVNDMASILKEQGLPPINEKKCKTKMDTLKRHYKYLKDANKKSGNSKISWPYFDEMEELFGEQPWVQPLSIAGSNIPNKIDVEVKSPPSKRQKTLKDFCEQLVEERKEREKIRESHHQQKIAAMDRLTNIVAQLIDKKNE